MPRQGHHRRLPAAGGDAHDRARSTRASSAEHEEFRTFFHGHTYTGNPLACAAALATLDVFEQERTLERLQPKIELLGAAAREPVAPLPASREVRRRGFMTGIELRRASRCAARMGHQVTLAARRRGAIIRPLGDVVVLMPPLAIADGRADAAGGDHRRGDRRGDGLGAGEAASGVGARAIATAGRARRREDGGRLRLATLVLVGLEVALRAPQTGQNQSSGMSSNAVPGGMPPSGSPSSGS